MVKLTLNLKRMGCLLKFWLILIVLIGVIICLVLQNSKLKKQVETPLDILKMRYAKGEVTKDEFENIKKGLTE